MKEDPFNLESLKENTCLPHDRKCGLNLLAALILLPMGLMAQPVARLVDYFPEVKTRNTDEIRLFSVEVNGTALLSDEFRAEQGGRFIHSAIPLEASISEAAGISPTTIRILTLTNLSGDTLELGNLVPLGMAPDRPCITGHGPPGLARATLFMPGKGPVGLIVPDNAWELGWTAYPHGSDGGISVLARRLEWKRAERRRYSTLLYPGGEVTYRILTESYQGDWKSALVQTFRKRWLYDLEEFDSTLYNRSDLRWIREDYLAVLQFAWDADFFQPDQGRYAPFREFFHRYDDLHGGYDIYGVWQGWPRLGLDQRNQWELFRDLPGGIDSMRIISEYCKESGTAFFLSYNPWDESTTPVDHHEALTALIRETGADGVVLDTRGSSSAELRQAADQAREGVVMYSEGMAVPKDMPGILSGRVHNAIQLSPPLNLNRLIKPDFQIFRVLDLRDGRLHREMAISLFNGYGAELNLFSPAHPWWVEEEYKFMGKCLMLLRQNSGAFHDPGWNPLVEAPDSIWVNEWHKGGKVLYTVLSLKPEGYAGPLLQGPGEDLHWVSLWDHELLELKNSTGDPAHAFLEARIDPFSRALRGTRQEGSVQVIAGFPNLLGWHIGDDSLKFLAAGGDRIQLWKGDPSYGNRNTSQFLIEPGKEKAVPLAEWLHHPEGKLVVQLFQGTELIDEQIIQPALATPVRIDQPIAQAPCEAIPEGMVPIQGGTFNFYRGNEADFIPYPDNFDTLRVEIEDFLMDRYPVTNRQFKEFLSATGYTPSDTSNFLKHWHQGTFPDSLAEHPVVWVSLEDARSYAKWAGKKLPTEAEWQYAAQGTDGRKWPWGDQLDTTAYNHGTGHTSPVHAHPRGQSPFGVEDMVGNVWQLCGDQYDNGSFTFSMIRGGSFYQPTSSWWYVQGGPQSNDHTQMLLRTSPGFDRSATVGFRCACDLP